MLETEFGAAARAYEAFERWAGTSNVVVFFEPDTVMAVDQPDRRGFLYDKVHFITIWASAGGDQLVEILRATVARARPRRTGSIVPCVARRSRGFTRSPAGLECTHDGVPRGRGAT